MVYLYCRICKDVTEHGLVGNKGTANLPFKPDTVIMRCTECCHDHLYKNDEDED